MRSAVGKRVVDGHQARPADVIQRQHDFSRCLSLLRHQITSRLKQQLTQKRA